MIKQKNRQTFIQVFSQIVLPKFKESNKIDKAIALKKLISNSTRLSNLGNQLKERVDGRTRTRGFLTWFDKYFAIKSNNKNDSTSFKKGHF